MEIPQPGKPARSLWTIMNEQSNGQEKLVICGHGDCARRGAVGRRGETACSITDCSVSGGLRTIIVNSEENNTSSPEYVYI
jgi:hypothetical protein